MCSSHTFARVEGIADEARRTRAPEAALVVVALGVFAARRPRTLVHVVTPGAIRVARVSFGTFTVVAARKVCTQRPGSAGVGQTAFVNVDTLYVGERKKQLNHDRT